MESIATIYAWCISQVGGEENSLPDTVHNPAFPPDTPSFSGITRANPILPLPREACVTRRTHGATGEPPIGQAPNSEVRFAHRLDHQPKGRLREDHHGDQSRRRAVCAAGGRMLSISTPKRICAAGLGIPEQRIELDIGDAMLAGRGGGFEYSRLIWRAGRNLDLGAEHHETRRARSRPRRARRQARQGTPARGRARRAGRRVRHRVHRLLARELPGR